MRTLLFLLLSWALSQPYATAQTRAAGPWRVRYRQVRVKREDLREEDVYYDLRNPLCRQIPTEVSAIAERNLLETNDAQEYTNQDSTSTSFAEDWGTPKSADTTTVVRTKRIVSKVNWLVCPDSIRLLLHCENPLVAPRRQAGIRFVATGATLRLDTKKLLLWLAPADSIVILRAYRGQRLVFRHQFLAVPPPMPKVDCYDLDGRNATIERPRPEETELINHLIVRAFPDKDFAAIMPNDAAYRVAKTEFILIRQGQVAAPLVFSGLSVDLYNQHFPGLPGDAIQITILLAQRRDFRGKIIDLPLTWKKLISYPHL